MQAIRAVAGYTLAPWEHALAVLRIAGPVQEAGLQLIQGNLYEDIHPERVSQADIVLLQRDFPQHSSAYRQILDRARQENKPVILDMDDLLLELPEDHPDRTTHYYAKALFPVLRALIEADAVTAATEPLCEYVRQFNPNVWLLPNYLKDDLWRLRPPKSPEEGGSPVVVGYMGGESHLPDLERILSALSDLLQRHGQGMKLRFWGIQPPAALRDHPNVEWTPLKINEYTEFARFFQEQECDIFIAPLADTRFNRCKSQVKFLEYSALGAPGVYSRIAPYERVVVHGENGFLASSPAEWVESVSRLIEEPSLRYQMGLEAQDTVRRDWLLSQHAHDWREAYSQIMGFTPARPKVELAHMELVFQLAEQVQESQRSLVQRLQEKEQENQRLKAALSAITQSNSWAALQRLRGLLQILAPEGSDRERFLQAILRSLK
jgi:glycosyltransferase involved in cell wall biosynthesis